MTWGCDEQPYATTTNAYAFHKLYDFNRTVVILIVVESVKPFIEKIMELMLHFALEVVIEKSLLNETIRIAS